MCPLREVLRGLLPHEDFVPAKPGVLLPPGVRHTGKDPNWWTAAPSGVTAPCEKPTLLKHLVLLESVPMSARVCGANAIYERRVFATPRVVRP